MEVFGMGQKVLVATHNKGKIAEFKEMMRDLALDWIGLADIGVTSDVAETGTTFEENAILKAKAYAAESGLLTLADDSGLEVDALDGQPGVYTARYGGQALTSKERYELLLKNLAGIPWEARTARFRCVIALVGEEGLLGTAAGTCEGVIAMQPAGEGGFGYDPVFYLPDKGLTMAQLPPGEKHGISHRGRAVAAVVPLLRNVIGEE
jgi:XTP/dITP diphosphohydrolase